MMRRSQALAVAVLFLGAALRFHALGQSQRFHPDEALFASFARAAAVQGDWLLHGHLDKPPLTIYANALAMTFFGMTTLPDGVLTLDVHRGEFAVRILGVFVSLLALAAFYALARRLKVPANLALLLLALSPLAVAFSATAFTDGMLLLCLVLAFWSMSEGGWGRAGLYLALGLGCKQQAALAIPLVIGIGWAGESRISWRHLLRLTLPILAGIGLLLAWDAARGQAVPFWALAAANNDPGRLTRLDELLPRARDWWGFLHHAAGSSLLTLLMLTAAVSGLIQRPPRRIDIVLAMYAGAYLVLHWIVAINIYDRYLLPVLLVILLLAARGVDGWIAVCSSAILQFRFFAGAGFRPSSSLAARIFLAAFLLIAALPGALAAARGCLGIGGDNGRHTGIDHLAVYLNQQRLGAIIYDHWLGWELGYYLGPWSDKRRVYYPAPETLAADALLQPDPAPRYLPVPSWAEVQPWLDALKEAGFRIQLVYDQAPFRVYELLPPWSPL
jgi:4-amino-4-deoxy-L-arabinose transferase-like glycosyltransferase